MDALSTARARPEGCQVVLAQQYQAVATQNVRDDAYRQAVRRILQ